MKLPSGVAACADFHDLLCQVNLQCPDKSTLNQDRRQPKRLACMSSARLKFEKPPGHQKRCDSAYAIYHLQCCRRLRWLWYVRSYPECSTFWWSHRLNWPAKIGRSERLNLSNWRSTKNVQAQALRSPGGLLQNLIFYSRKQVLTSGRYALSVFVVIWKWNKFCGDEKKYLRKDILFLKWNKCIWIRSDTY